jgi:YVTN family beta-propeller protein
VTLALVQRRPTAIKALTPAAAARRGVAVSAAAARPTVTEVPVSYTHGLVVSPDGKRVYAVSESDDNVIVFDTASNTEVGNIAVGSHPFGIAISRDGARVYVTSMEDGTVSVIDTGTDAVVSTFAVGVRNDDVRAIAVGADGKYVYVGKYGSNDVAVVDTTTEKVVDTITLDSPMPDSLIVSPDGTKLYVSSGIWSRTLTVVDTDTNEAITAVPLPSSVMAVSPDGKRLYVVADQSVAVIDTSDYSTVATIPTVDASSIGPIAVSPDGARVYVAMRYDFNQKNQVLVIDTATDALVDTIQVALSLDTFLVVSPDSSRLFLTVAGNGTSRSDAQSAWFYNSFGVFAQRGANGIRNIVGTRSNPNQPGPGNSQKEIDWEYNWETFNLYTGWLPGWGTVINGVSLGFDLGQMINAIGRGDVNDIADEFGDITGDLIGLIPVAGGFGKTAAKAGIAYAGGELATGVAHVVDDVAYKAGEFTYNAGNAIKNAADNVGNGIKNAWNWLTGR